jgi:ABC-2 type transport system ATP-binding protein
MDAVVDVVDAPPPPGNQTVVASRVSKWFGDVVAVSDVSFAVWPGVTALLGPNGAGKSTMLRMLAGLAPTSQGEVSVLGANPRKDKDVRGRIGLVPQQEGLFAEQRAIEFVTLAAQLNNVQNARQAARDVLDIVELDPDDQRPILKYSKGMKQRVKLAQAIVHKPDLLLLDEPLTGLDPRQRLHMIELIRDLGTQGVSVIVSSHVLDEVERLGSRVLVIAQGRLAAQGDFHEIRALMDDRPHRIRVRTNDPRTLGAALLTSAGVSGVTVASDGAVLVDTDDVDQFRRNLAPVAKQLDLQLLEVRPLDDDLESVFKYLVGR